MIIIQYFFWLLPYSIRYNLYKLLKKKKFLISQKLRKKKENHNGPSLYEFDRLKCIYIHIPKTGGVSINNSLFNSLGGSHIKIKNYSLIYSRKEFNKYYKFTLVRNPYDRLASAYFFLKNKGFHEVDYNWYLKNISKYKDFNDFVISWINKSNIYSYIHFIPQFEFVIINNKIQVNDIFKMENIDTAFELIKKRLHLDSAKLLKINITPNKKIYKELYTDKMKNIVYKTYKKDFELFKYSKEL